MSTVADDAKGSMDTPAEPGAAAPTSAPDGPTDKPPVRWHLLWCQPHCFHKTGAQAKVRETLKHAVRGLGGSMLCFNRASKFNAWHAKRSRDPRGPGLPYILLTDYAGAQLIMGCLQERPGLPAALLLFCDDSGTVQQACTWVWLQGFFESLERVSVHQDVNSIVQELARLSARRLTASTEVAGMAEPLPKTPWTLPRKLPAALTRHESFTQALAGPAIVKVRVLGNIIDGLTP